VTETTTIEEETTLNDLVPRVKRNDGENNEYDTEYSSSEVENSNQDVNISSETEKSSEVGDLNLLIKFWQLSFLLTG